MPFETNKHRSCSYIILIALNLLVHWSKLICNVGSFKARVGITEVHFLPFNPTDKRTALTYLDKAGKMHRVSKGAPEQVKYIS